MKTHIVKSIFKGKTIGRILFNEQVAQCCKDLRGTVLDLAGGNNASYYSLLPKHPSYIKTDYKPGQGIDAIVDITKLLPFTDASMDAVLFFNALYIIKDRRALLKEIKRVMKPEATLFLSSPFLSNEMPEPHDYARLTHEGLMELFKDTGFKDITIKRYGDRFTTVANLLHPFFIFNSVRVLVYLLSLSLDKIIPKGLTTRYPAPIGYFCIVKQ